MYAISWSGSLDWLRPEILLRVLVFLIPLGLGVWLGNRRFVTTTTFVTVYGPVKCSAMAVLFSA